MDFSDVLVWGLLFNCALMSYAISNTNHAIFKKNSELKANTKIGVKIIITWHSVTGKLMTFDFDALFKDFTH